MKMRVVLVGVLLALGALASAGCSSSDDKTLVKWSCSCGDACAASEEDAKSQGTGFSCDQNVCTTTGDICACPGGGSKCAILIL
jgi:hypothetical protein